MNLLLTPFGVPFDTAVLAGLVLTGIAIALSNRRSAPKKRARKAGGSQENRS